jgi:hypothetical protein
MPPLLAANQRLLVALLATQQQQLHAQAEPAVSPPTGVGLDVFLSEVDPLDAPRTARTHSSTAAAPVRSLAAALARLSPGLRPAAPSEGAALCHDAASCHPNVLPLLAAKQLLAPPHGSGSSDAADDGSGAGAGSVVALVHQRPPHLLSELLRFAPNSLGGDMERRFLLYQLLSVRDVPCM